MNLIPNPIEMRILVACSLLIVLGCSGATPSPSPTSREKLDNESARNALIELLKEKPESLSSFRPSVSIEKLKTVPVEIDAEDRSKISFGDLQVDLKSRKYRVSHSYGDFDDPSGFLEIWTFKGEFEQADDGTWIATEPVVLKKSRN